MRLTQPTAQLFVPDGLEAAPALARTTHLAIGAHQDDLEIMAPQGITACYRQPDKWFTGVVVTDGRGSPRAGRYAAISDADLAALRNREQCNAAQLGEYAAQFLLGWPSATIKDAADTRVVEELAEILRATQPEVLYTHNLADKHETHVAVALRVIAAVRSLPPEARPRQVYGCEVWRGLDWMLDEAKVVFDVTGHESLLNALIGCFDSQIAGGKRYDLASAGRRTANATYGSPRIPDSAREVVYAMDLTPLARDDALTPAALVEDYLDAFRRDVASTVKALAPGTGPNNVMLNGPSPDFQHPLAQ